MVVQTVDEISVPTFSSAPGRLFLRMAVWHETRHQRRVARQAMAEIPASLRQDIGLDGGAPLHPNRQPGRGFVHHDTLHDRAPGGYFW